MANSRLKQFSRRLRKNPTPQEYRLWHFLRGRRMGGYKFRRQFVLDPYILDFYCPKKRLGIEVDGSGHLMAKRQKLDERRRLFLKKKGIRVIRVGNQEINTNLSGVLDFIETHLAMKPLTPAPLP